MATNLFVYGLLGFILVLIIACHIDCLVICEDKWLRIYVILSGLLFAYIIGEHMMYVYDKREDAVKLHESMKPRVVNLDNDSLRLTIRLLEHFVFY
jgi:hypothetical protein